MALFDSLVNFVSGLGGPQDKSSHNRYGFVELPPDQLMAAFRGDWIARKIVTIPAEDATREWRAWQADKDQITSLEREEKRLSVKQKTKEALTKDRLFGGAGILIGVQGAGDWFEPLDLNRVKRGSLKYIHAVDRLEIAAGAIDRDPTSPYFGEPKYYSITSETVGSVVVHPSRFVRFVSNPLPSRIIESDGWGDSVLQAIDDAVKNAGLSSQGIATLINEASVDVIKVPDLAQHLATEDRKNRLIERFQLAKIAQSLINVKIIDSQEEWDKRQVTFANLPEVIQTYLMIASGAGDIPATRMLGQSPAGLSSTGESDLRNYYDNVAAKQKNFIEPTLSKLDEVLIRSALGNRPPEIYYTWNSLWQTTPNERAEVLLKRSQAVGNIFNTGLVPDEAFGEAVQNMLIEDGSLPGLEAALDALEDAEIDEDDPEVRRQFTGDG